MSEIFKNKNFWVGLIFLLALVLVSKFGVSRVNDRASTAMMIINFGNGKERTFKGEPMPQMTILDALHASGRGGDIKVRYYIGRDNAVKLGAINDEINNTNNRTWHFYLNKNEVKAEDINKVFVNKGDVVEARFK